LLVPEYFIPDFVHVDPQDDFEDDYKTINAKILIQKEWILVNANEDEIFVYTNLKDKINGYAVNID
jgi:hypothetical protein